jgi:uncharacterized protein (TIGR02996 family)
VVVALTKDEAEMSDIDGLLAGAVENPTEPAPRLVLADWLEERDEPPDRERAELLRLQVRLESGEGAAPLHERARQIRKQNRSLLRVLAPLFRHKVEPLSLNPALALVLGAPVASVVAGPLQVGSVWTGHLHLDSDAYPTELTFRRRKGNSIEGDMDQDFEILFPGAAGRFFFRGVVAGRSRLLFVTYRVEGWAAWPGLYELQVRAGGHLTGTWWLPEDGRRGELRLRRQRQE